MLTAGSIEIISNNVSTGMVVRIRDLDAVPVLVEAGQGLTDVSPIALPDGVVADAAWEATTAEGFPALVLWREDRDVVPDMPVEDEEEEEDEPR